MKKLLTIALSLILIISCFALASCDDEEVKTGIEAKDVEENAHAALTQAMGNATGEFMNTGSGAGQVIESALNKGSVSIFFESDNLMGGEITKVGATTYFDMENNKLVETDTIVYNGEELSANLFVDKNGIVISGESVLGSDAAYLLNLATFIENLETSALSSMMGILPEDTAEREELKKTINEIRAAYEKMLSIYTGDAEKLYNEIYELLELNVTAGELDGKEVLVVSYTANQDTMKAVVTKLMGEIGNIEGVDIDELFENTVIDAQTKIYIDKNANKVIKETVDFDFTQKYEDGEPDETVAVKMEAVFGDSEISVKCDITENGEAYNAEAKLTKATEGTKTTYNAVVSVTNQSVTVEMLNASYTYDISNGDIVLAVEANMSKTDTYSFELKGKLTKTDKKATLEFTSLKMDKVTIKFKAVIAFEVLDQIPSAPSDAKDVSILTEEELGQLMQDFQGSKLFELIQSMQ